MEGSKLAVLSRRRFLGTLGGGAIAVIAAACGVSLPSGAHSGRPLPSTSPTPTQPLESTPSSTSVPSVREKIGQMLLVGFRGLTIEESASIVADIQQRNLGGILLFDYDTPTSTPVRNVASPAQLTALLSGLQAVAATPLIVAIDEEGGKVARLDQRHGFPATVSEQAMGELNDLTYTLDQASAMATTLRSVGVNLNLAPVVDLNVNPSNPIIGSLGRSFSADPAVVVEHAGAFIDAHHTVDVACTLKHFPGHGSSTGDTHLGVVDVTKTWSAVELEPFARLVAKGNVDAILTAHVFNRALDAAYPATLSQWIISGILRKQLGYNGLVLSDDMQMGAIRDAFGYQDAVRLAINAGVDILTIANQQIFEEGIVGRTVDLVEQLVGSGAIPEARIHESYGRIAAFKATLG